MIFLILMYHIVSQQLLLILYLKLQKTLNFVFKIYFILISIVSFILGLKIIYERDNYIIKEFEEYNLLYIFIIIYTFGFFSALILSFVISFLI